MNGITVKKLRKECGYTQKQMAEKIGCTEAHLSNIEKGKRNINKDLQDKVKNVCGVSLSDQIFIHTQIIDGEVLNGLILDIMQDYYELSNCGVSTNDAVKLWERYIKKINRLFR